MKMKKPTSMATVISRTCPRCFTMVDPLWYGWHVTKCRSDKQDMAPSTTLMMDETDMSRLVGSTCQEVSISLPALCALSLAPDLQISEENSREESKSSQVNEHEITQLRAEKQALADRVKDLELQLEGFESRLNAEKQASAKKIKNLELNVEKMECDIKLAKEAEGKALQLIESLHGSSKEDNGHVNEAGNRNQLAEITTCCEPKRSSHEESMELGNDEIFSLDKHAKEVDYRDDEDSNPLKEGIEEIILTKIAHSKEETQLDRVVGFACAGEPMSEDFLSQVDECFESHKAFAITSKMQESPFQPSVNANIGDLYKDIVAKIGNQDSTKQHCHSNESPHTIAIHEEYHTAPCVAVGTPFDISNEDPSNNWQVDGHDGAKLNQVSVVKPSHCGLRLDAQGAALDMLFDALDKDTRTEVPQVLCERNSHAKQAHSHSSSSSLEAEGRVFKAKTGLRRTVLSDSETEGVNIRGNYEGGNHNDPCTENGVRIGVSQQPRGRRRQLKAVQTSDMSHDDVCNGMSKPSSQKCAELPLASVSNTEGGGVGGIEDGEHTGVRRSKRLRMLKAQIKDPGIPSSRNKIHGVLVSSSTSEATRGSFEGVQGSTSEASEDTHSRKVEASLEVQSTLLSKKRARRLVVAPMTDSEETSGSVVESKKPRRVRKRLFEEVESKPAYGNNHPLDSEEEVDGEIGSDKDSLKDFIVTDSEDTGELRSSDDGHYQSLSGSHSSREAFCDPKLTRDIKIRSYVWEIEPEMLATFAIDSELCLRALCAINRRQTEDEQVEKVSKYSNKRGFDNLHARRGTRIAEFLTEGDPTGPVKKSIKDLKKWDFGALRFCKMMAVKHSKQLFEIYTAAEDPHFPFA